jgi:4-hydroxy-3-methylbut-2-en-1-yl diphosphate reductase
MFNPGPALRTTEIPSAPGEGQAPPRLRVILAAPRGFCAGVERAIAAVEEALARFGAPVYVRRPIVHNRTVMRALEAKGAVFVEELDEVPPGAILLFSAHGVAPAIAEEAARRSLTTYDAVCPLVAKVHREVARHHRNGRHVLLIGHHGHPEVEGTLGQVPPGAVSVVQTMDQLRALDLPRTLPVAYAVQTTYSVEDAAAIIVSMRALFDDVRAPATGDICYATTNRQAALRAIAGEADAIVVVGASFSSNANRLADIAREAGCRSVQLIEDGAGLDWAMLAGAETLGITSAASTPESCVAEILELLGARFRLELSEHRETNEAIMFKKLRLD